MTWQNVPIAWGGRTQAWGLAGGERNFIDRLVYDVAYEGQDVSGANWAPAGSGVTLVAQGTNPTTGVSTAGWSNLPDRLVNQAIQPGSAEFQNDLFDWENNDFHFRCLVDLNDAAANGERLIRYLVSGVRVAEIRLVSDVNISFTVRNDSDGGLFTGIASGGGFPLGPLLIDWVVSGVSMNIFVNGVDYGPADHPGPVNFTNGADTLTVMGPNVLAGSTVPFMGWRWGQTISLADHQDDVTEAGL